MTDWQLTGKFYARTAVAGALVDLTATRVIATNSIAGGNGVLHAAADAVGGNASMTVRDSTISEYGSSNAHGVATHGNNVTGSATTTVINTNIYMGPTSTTGNGIIAYVNGSGLATVTFTGGSISADNTGAAILAASGGSGNALVTASAGTIRTTGSNSTLTPAGRER